MLKQQRCFIGRFVAHPALLPLTQAFVLLLLVPLLAPVRRSLQQITFGTLSRAFVYQLWAHTKSHLYDIQIKNLHVERPHTPNPNARAYCWTYLRTRNSRKVNASWIRSKHKSSRFVHLGLLRYKALQLRVLTKEHVRPVHFSVNHMLAPGRHSLSGGGANNILPGTIHGPTTVISLFNVVNI